MNFLSNLTKKPRVFQRILGLSLNQFNLLAKNVNINLKKYLNKQEKETNKKRLPGGGRKPKLAKVEEKLLVTLLYYKMYLTQEFIGLIFFVDQSTVSRTITLVSEVIEQSADPKINEYLEEAKKNASKGKNYIANMADFIMRHPELEEIITDATESPCYRPKNNESNKEYYSGKSKKHTIKTQITVSSSGRVLDVSKSYPGSVHDKKVLDKEKTIDKTTRNSRHFMDKGYCGAAKENIDKNILIPFKKSKGGKLSAFQKEVNRYISRKRIIVEHVIGKLKNSRIISDVYRGPKGSFNKVFRNIAAIWNFTLATTSNRILYI